jgi:surfactin synthase thioesterase subunit
MRWYCFPHAGGAPGEYARWSDAVEVAEVNAVQLPGRGARYDEQPFTDVAGLRDAVVGAVSFQSPFILFGHSLGALIAFEVARALEQRGHGPSALVVSAARAPHLPARLAPISHLGDRELLEHVAGGPARRDESIERILEDSELLELMLPGLRADLQMAERYRCFEAPPLRCRLVACGGLEDDVTRHDLEQWSCQTSTAFAVQMFQGHHFYTRSEREAVIALLEALSKEVL